MIDRFRQLSEPRMRQQAEIEKSQTPVERDILVQWVSNGNHFRGDSLYRYDDGWIDDLRIYVLFHSVSVILGR